MGDDIRLDTGIMAMDLNRAVIGFETEPDVFAQFMREQAAFRDFTGALILSSEGDILLASDPASQRKYERPTQDMFDTANQGDVSVLLSDQTLQFWALYKLLISTMPIFYCQTDRLSAARQSTKRRADAECVPEGRRAKPPTSDHLPVGLQSDHSIDSALCSVRRMGSRSHINPILKLAKAADQVRHGDLSVQVFCLSRTMKSLN